MSTHILTWHSKNAPIGQAWLAYIEHGKKMIGIRFNAPTEEEVKDKVRAFWKAERERAAKLKGDRA